MADRTVELGLVDVQALARELRPSALDEPLDYYGQPDHLAVLRLLDDLGIGYTVDSKTFRGVHEEGLELYQRELEWIAARGRGLLTVTGVELVDANRDHLLRFRCNGEQREWPIRHGPDEDFDAQLTFATYLGDLVPAGSPARWCGVDPQDPDEGSQYVFGDPDALRQLGEQFGLAFDPLQHP